MTSATGVGADAKLYELAQELRAHSDDVKCVIPVGAGVIASASRDGTVGIWKQGDDSRYSLTRILAGHTGYVNSLAHIPPPLSEAANELAPVNLIASAGNASHILLHDLDPALPSDQPLAALTGHHANVCALAWSDVHQTLLSASWDCAARVWQRKRRRMEEKGEGEKMANGGAGEWECVRVLPGHEAAVWGVAVVDEGPLSGHYLTGSADCTIKIWPSDPSAPPITLSSFPAPVRSIVVLPGGEAFAAAFNDGAVRVLSLVEGKSGKEVSKLEGHEDYVYHVDAVPSPIAGSAALEEGAYPAEKLSQRRGSLILSCGEDHTTRLWQDGKLLDTILHPCQTVWCSSFLLANSDSHMPDIVTAGSDNIVRIWTADTARMASEEERKAYADGIARIMTSRAKPNPPARDGENAASQPFGEGEHVLDIDIEDGAPPLQLRFSNDSDPAETAQAFGQTHGLSERYITQITEFLSMQLGGRR